MNLRKLLRRILSGQAEGRRSPQPIEPAISGPSSNRAEIGDAPVIDVASALPPQPWSYKRSAGRPDRDIGLLPAAPDHQFVAPHFFGRDTLPRADAQIDETITFPAVPFVAFNDVIAIRRHVLVSPHKGLLPQSFMRSRRVHHGGVRMTSDERYCLRFPAELAGGERLNGQVFYADTDYPDVYGHVLLEVLPRLWPLADVDAGVPILSSIVVGRSYARMLEQLGVDPDRMKQLNGPVRCEELLVPDVPIRRRRHFHPQAFETFERLKGLAASGTVNPAERIFVSRSHVGGRALLQEREVEELFEGHGFTIVHPQELSIEDQIRLFAGARLIAGTGGSGMHNTVFSRDDAKVLILCSSGWLVKADMLINQTPGKLAYVFGEPVRSLRRGHRTQMEWTIDVDAVRQAIHEHFDLREGAVRRVELSRH